MSYMLFIINPIAGGQTNSEWPDRIVRYLDSTRFSAHFLFTKRVGHAYEMAMQLLDSPAAIIVAVGGDGTINEVASALEGTDKVMGIIPCGSGNGLARFLGISRNLKRAVGKLNKCNVNRIDSGLLNDRKFFSIAGFGFDAHISARFANSQTRGLKAYAQITLKEISSYQSQSYVLEIDGIVLKREAFILSIANSSQYGNNVHIAPTASVKDGLLDVCIVRKFPWYYFPVIAFHIFNKTAHRSKYIEIIKARYIKIYREKPGIIHLDGEPVLMKANLEITVKPNSLRMIC